MIQITVPSGELWDEVNNEFISAKSQTLQLEHSLVSLSKWEAKWKKPFLVKGQKTAEEINDYIKCMTLTQNVDPNIYFFLTKENMKQIENYIGSPMTATVVRDKSTKGRNKVITSEVIYYWMISLGVPFECQKWHLNRLLTLIKVCEVENRGSNSMTKREIHEQNAALNAARRSKYKTRG